MAGDVNRPPAQRQGGYIRLPQNPIPYNLEKPIWWGGAPLERVLDTNAATFQMKEAFGSGLLPVEAISFSPSYFDFAKDEFPTTFTATPEHADMAFVAGVIYGTMSMLADETFANGYGASSLLKVVTNDQTIDTTALTGLPAVQPVNLADNGVGIAAAVADVDPITGADWRLVQGIIADVVGVADKDVAAKSSDDNEWVDVVLTLKTPPLVIPAA